MEHFTESYVRRLEYAERRRVLHAEDFFPDGATWLRSQSVRLEAARQGAFTARSSDNFRSSSHIE
jgi:hypothetical protein